MARRLYALVIDNADTLAEATSIISEAGFYVDVAKSGQEALTLAQQKNFSLIFCSDRLSDMSGSNFCGQLRALSGYDFASVLLLTSQNASITLKQAILAGVTDVFEQSELGELETHVTRFIEGERRQLSGRALLVEDSRVIQTIVLDILIDLGLDVDAYTYAEEAWDIFQQGDYDIVITDILLEGVMSGISLVRKIRALPGQFGDVPIIATSGFDNKSRKVELFHLGVSDFISKPIVREELRHRVINNVTSYQNLREVKHQQNSMHSLSMLDDLTQLFNRHALKAFSAKYFSEAYRFNRKLSLAVINIDHMQKINEQWGYETGDRVLSDIATWLKRCVRDIDMLSRWGGDDFIVILPNCDETKAYELMTRVHKRLKKFNPAGIDITLSIGIATNPENEKHTLMSLFDLADTAMHQAKIVGRDSVEMYQADFEITNAE